MPFVGIRWRGAQRDGERAGGRVDGERRSGMAVGRRRHSRRAPVGVGTLAGRQVERNRVTGALKLPWLFTVRPERGAQSQRDDSACAIAAIRRVIVNEQRHER